jgi:hypothetical protein
VIDEMKGVDSSQEAIKEDNSSFILLSSPSPARGSEKEADTHDNSPPVTIPPPTMDRTLGSLEDEFVVLLQRRATEEEADAKELRALASRLERIAKGRRRLAANIMERRHDH